MFPVELIKSIEYIKNKYMVKWIDGSFSFGEESQKGKAINYLLDNGFVQSVQKGNIKLEKKNDEQK